MVFDQSTMDEMTTEISAVAVFINIICLYGFGAMSYIIPMFTGVYRRGFFCDDETILFKFQPNTVPVAALISVSIIMTLLSILFCEYYVMYKLESTISRPSYRWRNSHIQAYIVESLIYFAYSQIGFIVQLVLTQSTKYTIGRLRPHFIDVCKPVNYTCTTEHDYIADYTCTGDLKRIREGRLSFFSGHSCMAVYSAVFAILYLQSRLGGRMSSRLFLPIIQTFLLTASLLVCYSRITDNWHHWSDVLVGMLVGATVAIYTAVFWGGFFKHRRGYAPLNDPSGVHILASTIATTNGSLRTRNNSNEEPTSSGYGTTTATVPPTPA